MGKSFNKNSRVKIPAIVHLARLNYKYVSLKAAEQKIDEETNICKDSFLGALNKINGINLTDKDADSIISELKNLLDAEDLGRNFYAKFFTGISFAAKTVRLIDFDDPKNNTFEVMTEVPYRNGSDSFRPDITIFVNGLPLAFVEVNDEEVIPLESVFYAASDYRKLFFNRFREEDFDIYNQIAPLDEVVEKAILKDTNYLSIRATNEYETNKSPLTPTNKI